MCILWELATAISVQVTSVRRWDWSNTVQKANGMVSLHGRLVKIRVIINVYLQELCYILLVMNLCGITVKCMVYHICRSIVFVWEPNISDWDSETNCFTIIQLYYMLLWRLLNFTNKHNKVISLNQYKYISCNVLQPVLCVRLTNNNHNTRFAIAFNFAYAILNLSHNYHHSSLKNQTSAKTKLLSTT